MSETPEDHPGLAAVTGRVLGLGREVESLRRMVETQRRQLRDVEDRGIAVDRRLGALATTIAGLGDQLAALATREEEPAPLTSWFAVEQLADAERRLAGLVDWLEQVYLQLPDAALPTCWLWHPAAIEELLWLQRSWVEAYSGASAAVFRVADWHDRQRPGVVTRIAGINGGVCSLDRHAAGGDQARPARPALVLDGIGEIARWWVEARDEPLPYPSAAQLATAAGR